MPGQRADDPLLTGQLAGSVAAAIIDDDDLRAPLLLEPTDHSADRALFIVRGNDDDHAFIDHGIVPFPVNTIYLSQGGHITR